VPTEAITPAVQTIWKQECLSTKMVKALTLHENTCLWNWYTKKIFSDWKTHFGVKSKFKAGAERKKKL